MPKMGTKFKFASAATVAVVLIAASYFVFRWTSPNAEFARGLGYATGQGVSLDYAKAAYWWQKAAAKGYSKAQFDLSVLYHNGWGVTQDDSKAAYWCQKAADQGDADAEVGVGNLYYNGQGVPPTATQADSLTELY
jgi:TPR repeat protein